MYYISSKNLFITEKLKVNISLTGDYKMTYEPTNAELYNIIQRLCGKIENLEQKIIKLSENREI